MGIVRRETAPEIVVPILIIGGGACGLTAALAAHDAGAEVMVLERDASPSGSTALSSGFIPACGTRWQSAKGVEDSVDLMVSDIQAKNHGAGDADLAEAVARASGPTLEWLADAHGQQFVLLDGFRYPGHSALRMHAHPDKTGEALIASLLKAVTAAGIDVVTDAQVTDLIVDQRDRAVGVMIARPDGSVEEIGCAALILACNGYGGNPEMVKAHIPEMADALYFGHTGNQGDAVAWGEALGAQPLQMAAYQGHGSVAHPHGVLITWALMMEGGIQVNGQGRRFSNEHEGYSEQSVKVLAQPDGIAWNLYDARLHEMGLGFEDYRRAVEMGAIKRIETVAALAAMIGCPEQVLSETLEDTRQYAAGAKVDPFGRDFTGAPCLAGQPFHAVKVTGALFHTQGGLAIDTAARVLRPDGSALPNLFAGGGAAVGVSGTGVEGYLSGNGLLTAFTLGRIAGRSAAALARGETV
ncbi:MAG: FAD-dependent oxidoreductase [Alphaproteobacteria bacterium]|nr:FAD-dependent oxidoreductase [Alphaproteobacteria bacterium]